MENKTILPDLTIKRYDELIENITGVERKGAKNVYTSYNGHMFSFLDSATGELSIRLSRDDREGLILKYNTQLSVQYNTVMKEYVVVTNQLHKQTDELIKYFQLSFNFVSSLKPKATKKK